MFRFNALRGDYGAGDTSQQVAERIAQIARGLRIEVDQVLGDGRILEARYRPLMDGGLATTYRDVTDLLRTASSNHNAVGEMNEILPSSTISLKVHWSNAQPRFGSSAAIAQAAARHADPTTTAGYVDIAAGEVSDAVAKAVATRKRPRPKIRILK